jgi:hypothetical protein
MPNKTEATAYLDSDGPKPARYARAFGVHDCYYREYMVGYVVARIGLMADACKLTLTCQATSCC